MSIDLTKQYWTRDGDKVSNLFMLSTVFIFPLRGIITDSRGVAKEGQWTANGLHIPNQPTAMDLVDNNQLLFRHRSRSFDESMKTVVPINSMDDLLAELTKVIDSTGAGDLFASGFLSGLIKGRNLYCCGKMGSILAAEVISHYGARPELSLVKLLKEKGF